MSELYMHIGLHKTGTTFLQDAIFPNLKGIKYFYKPTNQKGEIDPFDINEKGKILISDEEISRSVPNRNHHTRLEFIQLLHKNFPDAKIILGLRDYQPWLKSCYSQYIKAGGYLKLNDYKQKYPHLKPSEYYRIIKTLWGEENTFVYWQENLKHTPNITLKQLCEFMNVDIAEYHHTSSNVSLKGWKLSLMRYINILLRGEFLRHHLESPYWILTYLPRRIKKDNRSEQRKEMDARRLGGRKRGLHH